MRGTTLAPISFREARREHELRRIRMPPASSPVLKQDLASSVRHTVPCVAKGFNARLRLTGWYAQSKQREFFIRQENERILHESISQPTSVAGPLVSSFPS